LSLILSLSDILFPALDNSEPPPSIRRRLGRRWRRNGKRCVNQVANRPRAVRDPKGNKAAGARQVFREVASGAKTDHSQLRRVLAQLDAGDVLMVSRRRNWRPPGEGRDRNNALIDAHHSPR
jgi:hypothetical protein